jgi:hypothetical protein
MQAVDETVNDVARQELEVPDAAQDLRIDESCAGDRPAFIMGHGYFYSGWRGRRARRGWQEEI